MASRPPDAASDPSGWKATVKTARECPSCSVMHVPLAASHSRHVPSKLAVATCAPMGCTARRPRRAVCPLSVCSSRPVDVHRRAVLSEPAVASVKTSGDCSSPASGCHAKPVHGQQLFMLQHISHYSLTSMGGSYLSHVTLQQPAPESVDNRRITRTKELWTQGPCG